MWTVPQIGKICSNVWEIGLVVNFYICQVPLLHNIHLQHNSFIWRNNSCNTNTKRISNRLENNWPIDIHMLRYLLNKSLGYNMRLHIFLLNKAFSVNQVFIGMNTYTYTCILKWEKTQEELYCKTRSHMCVCLCVYVWMLRNIYIYICVCVCVYVKSQS